MNLADVEAGSVVLTPDGWLDVNTSFGVRITFYADDGTTLSAHDVPGHVLVEVPENARCFGVSYLIPARD